MKFWKRKSLSKSYIHTHCKHCNELFEGQYLEIRTTALEHLARVHGITR